MGAAAGALGPRRASGMAFKALNKYGEFAENLPGFADSVEQGVTNVSGGRLYDAMNYLRQNRKQTKGQSRQPLAHEVSICQRRHVEDSLPSD